MFIEVKLFSFLLGNREYLKIKNRLKLWVGLRYFYLGAEVWLGGGWFVGWLFGIDVYYCFVVFLDYW